MIATIARLLFVSLCLRAVAAQQFAPAMRNCRDNHTDSFNECVMDVIKQIQPQLKDGFAELNLPRLEPLLLENVEFRQFVPPVTLEAIFRNVKVYGITAFDLKYLDLDFTTTRKQALGMVIPSLSITGIYKIGGNIFLLPIEGEGDIFIEFDGFIAEGTGDIAREGNKVVLKNINIGFKIRSMKIRMDNLFQGNKVLSDTIHHFLNENSDLVLEEIRPGITSQLNNLFDLVFNSMFSVLPPDILTEVPRNQQGELSAVPFKSLLVK